MNFLKNPIIITFFYWIALIVLFAQLAYLNKKNFSTFEWFFISLLTIIYGFLMAANSERRYYLYEKERKK